MKSDFFGWVYKRDPKFWENNGFSIKEKPVYYGCDLAEINHHPVYEKILARCSDYEDYSAVEVFSCDIGVVGHAHMAFLFNWNNAGWGGYPMIAAMQVHNIREYNRFIKDCGFDKMEEGETFLIKDMR